MTIGVDFDGTIVEDKFPEIGKGVSRIGKVLTAMRPAHRIIGHSVGRPDIE